jgi:2-amino-4-hydroxy-6-hydroxymethyldihydropteridine diphosphokinase
MARAGIALGSNLGDSLATLRSALAALRAISSDGKCLVAPIYQTRPLDCPPGSPDFLNTVVEIGFDGGARRLLETTRGIENRLGRTRGALRNAPRVIDLDLLYCGDERIDSEGLTLPHPRMLERRFVLQPLADIRPDLVLPECGLSVAAVLESLAAEASPPVQVAVRWWESA